MAIKASLQIVRKGSKYESFRITLPRAIIESHGLRDKDFEINVKDGKIVLTPVQKNSQ